MEKLSWTVTVEEDKETGEIVLPLPEELLKMNNWQEGDELEWQDNGDGTWSLYKVENNTEKKINE